MARNNIVLALQALHGEVVKKSNKRGVREEGGGEKGEEDRQEEDENATGEEEIDR